MQVWANKMVLAVLVQTVEGACPPVPVGAVEDRQEDH